MVLTSARAGVINLNLTPDLAHGNSDLAVALWFSRFAFHSATAAALPTFRVLYCSGRKPTLLTIISATGPQRPAVFDRFDQSLPVHALRVVQSAQAATVDC